MWDEERWRRGTRGALTTCVAVLLLLGAEGARAQCLLRAQAGAAFQEETGGEPDENAAITRAILAGQDRSPRRDVVLLNAAAALHVGGLVNDLPAGIEKAQQSIDGGAALVADDRTILHRADDAIMLSVPETIRDRIASGDFPWSVQLEDVHMNIEAELTEQIGIAGKKLHTGRSRNDQVATDVRLWLRDELALIDGELVRLFDCLQRQVRFGGQAVVQAPGDGAFVFHDQDTFSGHGRLNPMVFLVRRSVVMASHPARLYDRSSTCRKWTARVGARIHAAASLCLP